MMVVIISMMVIFIRGIPGKSGMTSLRRECKGLCLVVVIIMIIIIIIIIVVVALT